MIIAIQIFSIDVVYRPGKELAIVDALSRAYLQKTLNEKIDEELDVNFLKMMPISDNKLELLKEETKADCELQQLLTTVQTGWPENKADVPNLCRPYWNVRDEVSICDGVFLKDEKLIIPKNMCHEMLKIIHASHMGIDKCKRRAKDLVYWPGMISQIEDITSNCSTCNRCQKSQTKELMIPHNVPSRPWAQVGADLFELNG